MSASTTAELLVCDTTIVSMLRMRSRRPERLAHWPADAVARIDAARLAISVVTLAEARYGWLKNGLRSEFAASERRRLAAFALLPIDPLVIEAWADLKHAIGKGQTVSDNDLWIGATAHARGATVVTADTDFQPIADVVDVLYLQRTPDSRAW